jgi:hypothetical protein
MLTERNLAKAFATFYIGFVEAARPEKFHALPCGCAKNVQTAWSDDDAFPEKDATRHRG